MRQEKCSGSILYNFVANFTHFIYYVRKAIIIAMNLSFFLLLLGMCCRGIWCELCVCSLL